MGAAARVPGVAAEARWPLSCTRPRPRGPGHPRLPKPDYTDSDPCGASSSPPQGGAEGHSPPRGCTVCLGPCRRRLASAPVHQSRAARGAGGVCRACARQCGRLGREGGSKPTLCPIPCEPHDVDELVVGHRRTDLAGDRQEHRHILRAEAVVAALRKEETAARTSGELVHFVAHATFSHVTHTTG